ncbi:MAG TPA: hypothetical protein VHI97_00615 [Actinomycetota bacterium]|nr:hypothetical protein [Actinomycetota bacterium]
MAYPFENLVVPGTDRRSTDEPGAPTLGSEDSAVAVLAAATMAVIKTRGIRRRSLAGMKLLLELVGITYSLPSPHRYDTIAA